MNHRALQRLVSAALLLAVTPWCVGCATEIHLRSVPGAAEPPEAGRLRVRVFETRTDRRRDVATRKDVLTELYRVEGKTETLIREEKEPRWSITDLSPGAYLLRASRCVDEWGVVQTSFEPVDVRFGVRARETTFADVVLKDPKHAWVSVLVAIVLTCVVAEDIKERWYLEGITW